MMVPGEDRGPGEELVSKRLSAFGDPVEDDLTVKVNWRLWDGLFEVSEKVKVAQ